MTIALQPVLLLCSVALEKLMSNIQATHEPYIFVDVMRIFTSLYLSFIFSNMDIAHLPHPVFHLWTIPVRHNKGICQPMLLWWLNKRHNDKNKQQLPRADSQQTHTHVPVLIFCHVHWLEIPLRRWSLELWGGRQRPWWQAYLGGKIRRPCDAAPRYSANQADQRQRRHLHSSHSRKPVCPFHSRAHGPRRSDKATCWCVAPSSACHGLECFFIRLSLQWVAGCHTRLVPEVDSYTSAMLLKKKCAERTELLGFTHRNLCEKLRLIGCRGPFGSRWVQKWWMGACGATSDTRAEDERSISFSAESFMSLGCCAVFCFSQHVLISRCTYFSASVIWSRNTLMSLLIKTHGRRLGLYSSLQRKLSQPASYLNGDIWTWE